MNYLYAFAKVVKRWNQTILPKQQDNQCPEHYEKSKPVTLCSSLEAPFKVKIRSLKNIPTTKDSARIVSLIDIHVQSQSQTLLVKRFNTLNFINLFVFLGLAFSHLPAFTSEITVDINPSQIPLIPRVSPTSVQLVKASIIQSTGEKLVPS